MTRILLIEDNEAILDSMALELELRGYDVCSAQDGQLALELLATHPLPDVIVSDIAMPNLDGYQLLQQVQQKPDWNMIPFLFLTAFDSPSAIRQGKEMGVDDYLVKPFQIDDLVVAVENKIKRAHQYRELEARKLEQSRQQFMLMISHELRTPLNAIYGGVQMLQDSVENMPDDSMPVLLNIIHSGAKRMNRLVNQVLMLVQLDSGLAAQHIAKYTHEFDIREMVRLAWQHILAEVELTPEQLPIQWNIAEEPLLISGEQQFLIIVFEEIFRNAVRFNNPDHPIQVRIALDDQQVVVQIRDFGQGMRPESLPTVWGRFVQIDRDEQEQQGAGLGLALVKEITLLHKGSATIDSRVGQGTLVTITLPQAQF